MLFISQFLFQLSRVLFYWRIDCERLSFQLLVENQRWRVQNNVWNLFKVNNKDIRMKYLINPLSASVALI